MSEEVIVINCLWCSEPGFSDSHVHEFITRDRYDCNNPEWFGEAYSDLCSCFDCVEEFHRSLDSLLVSSIEDALALKKSIHLSNVARLSDRLKELLDIYSRTRPKVKVEGEDYGSDIDYQLKASFETPLLEILSHPRLLLDASLCDLFVSALELLLSADLQLEIARKKLPGAYLLLVHPCSLVRCWSVGVVRGLGPVDWDDYDDLEEVVHWLINVVLFDMFSDPQSDIGRAAWDDSVVVMLPKHLFNHKSKKDFWLGLCMLLTSLDTTCIRSKLMSSSSGNPEIAENILQTLRHSDQSVFLPVLKCFSVLLDRLGSRFWQFDNATEPKTVCETIFSHCVFVDKVKEMCKKKRQEGTRSRVYEDMSSSQLVYQPISESKKCDPDLKSDEQLSDCVVFSWIVPFMQSLLDFNMERVNYQLFDSVKQLLSRKGTVEKSQSFLYHEVINTLVRMVRTLYSKQAYSMLLTCQDFWIQPLIKSVDHLSPTSQRSVIKLFRALLSSPTTKFLPNTQAFISHLKLPLRCSLSKITASLSRHIANVLKVLAVSGHETSINDVPTEDCTCIDPVEDEPDFSSSHVSTPKQHDKGLVKVKKEGEPSSSCQSPGRSALEQAVAENKERPSASGTSTDELEEWECGPPSLRETSLSNSPSKKVGKKRLSLNRQSNRVVYEERSRTSLADPQHTPKKQKLTIKPERTTVTESPSTPVSVKPIVISQDMETPPLSSDSSSDSELPSLSTLMTTPTNPSKRKFSALKTTNSTLSSKAASRVLEFVGKSVKMEAKSKPDYKGTIEVLVEVPTSAEEVSSRTSSNQSTTNKVEQSVRINRSPHANLPLNLSHEKVENLDKFSVSSEDEVFLADTKPDSASIVNLSFEDVTNLDDFSEDEQCVKNSSTVGESMHDMTDDDIKMLDEFSEDEDIQEVFSKKIAEIKKISEHKVGPPGKVSLNQSTSPVHSNSLPPDSQSESGFVFRDLADSKEDIESEDIHETLFDAFEAQAEAKKPVAESSEFGSEHFATKQTLVSPKVTKIVETTSLKNVSELTEGEKLQEVHGTKVQLRKSKGQSLDVSNSNDQYTTEEPLEDLYSDVSSDEFYSQPVVQCRSQSPKMADVSRESNTYVSDLSSAPSSNSSLSVPNSLKLSFLSVDVVRMNIKSMQKLIIRRKSKEDSSTDRKRKREPESPVGSGPLLPSSIQHDSKRPKLKPQKPSEFLSSRVVKPKAPKIVEPPGLVFSAKKSVLQGAYRQSAGVARAGTIEQVQTSSSSSSEFVPSKPKTISTLHQPEEVASVTKSNPLLISSLPGHSGQSLGEETLPADAPSGELTQSSSVHVTQHFDKLGQSEHGKRIPYPVVTCSSSGVNRPHPVSPVLHGPALPAMAKQRPHGFKPGPTSPTVPFKNKLTSSTANLMSTLPSSPTSPRADRPLPPPVRPQNLTIATRPSRLRTMNDLYAAVLSWDADKFLYPEQDERGGRICPPCTEEIVNRSAYRVPLTFLSYDQYLQVFAPLFFMELWQSVFNEIVDPKYKPPSCSCIVETVTHSGYIHNVRVKAIMPSSAAREYAHPTERDLIVVKNRQGERCFAIVEQQKHTFFRSTEGPSCEVLIDVKLSGQFGVVEKSEVELSVVKSLTNEIRQWIGLINFHTSLLARDLLYPRGREYFCHSSVSQPTLKISGAYNLSQRESIATAARAMCAQYAQPRVLLLQGPPGTGKTHTISGLIRVGFQELSKLSASCRPSSLPGSRGAERKRPHILVCAPSNAAVDEVIRKMIKDGIVASSNQTSGGSTENSVPRALKVVRIGNKEKIHPQIIPFSLDEQAKKKIKTAAEQEAANSRKMDEIRQKISTVEERIEDARKQLYIQSTVNKTQPDKTVDLAGLQARIRALELEKTELNKRHRSLRGQCVNNKRDQAIIRKRVLLDADIVCATLCGSGSSALSECIKNIPQHFNCVVVDEASQCTELDVLVPLRYRASKLILVGDPLQLPATIHSRQAERQGYGQSLFERLYRHFISQTNEAGNPVKMLNVQYRMLPEICYFPSKHFYSDQLQTDSSAESSVSLFGNFNCFLMFNVLQGNEDKVDGSLRNIAECQFLLALLKVLRRNRVQPRSIGVITPYKAQEKHIKYLIKKELTDMAGVDVGTVDGFQGREKDIIVLSCVRANSWNGSVGFLCDRKRLNVALTRAKRVLYVLGHHNTLQVNKDWAALIQHAKSCNAVVDVKASDLNKAIDCISKRCAYSAQLKYTKSKTATNYRGPSPSAPLAMTSQLESRVSSVVEQSERQRDPRSGKTTASILKAEVISASKVGPSDPRLVSGRITSNAASALNTTEGFKVSSASIDELRLASESSIKSEKLKNSSAFLQRRLSSAGSESLVTSQRADSTPAPLTDERRNSSTSSETSITNLQSRNISTEQIRNFSGSSESFVTGSKPHDPQQIPLDHTPHLPVPYHTASKVPLRHLTHSLSSDASPYAYSPPMNSRPFKRDAVSTSRVARTPHHNVNTKEKLHRVTQVLTKESQYRKSKHRRNSGGSTSNIRELLSKSKKLT